MTTQQLPLATPTLAQEPRDLVFSLFMPTRRYPTMAAVLAEAKSQYPNRPIHAHPETLAGMPNAEDVIASRYAVRGELLVEQER